MRRFQRLFVQLKNTKKAAGSHGLWPMLTPSVIGIALCIACLCGTSWAWFAASAVAKVPSIHAATYTLSYQADSGEATAIADSPTYTMQANTCTMTLTAVGTEGATGCCTVEIGNATYHTAQIPVGSTFTFTVNAPSGTDISLISQWGSCAEEPTLQKYGIIGTPVEETTVPADSTYSLSYQLGESEAVPLAAVGTPYTMTGDTCEIRLLAAGSAGASGYCTVQLGDRTYTTEAITVGEDGAAAYSFTVTAPAGTIITLTPHTGALPETDTTEKIPNGGTIALTDDPSEDTASSPSDGNDPEKTAEDTSASTPAPTETGTDADRPSPTENAGENSDPVPTTETTGGDTAASTPDAGTNQTLPTEGTGEQPTPVPTTEATTPDPVDPTA